MKTDLNQLSEKILRCVDIGDDDLICNGAGDAYSSGSLAERHEYVTVSEVHYLATCMLAILTEMENLKRQLDDNF